MKTLETDVHDQQNDHSIQAPMVLVVQMIGDQSDQPQVVIDLLRRFFSFRDRDAPGDRDYLRVVDYHSLTGCKPY